MPDDRFGCLLIADFTIDNFAGLLTNDDTTPVVETRSAPFDQVVPTLLDSSLPCWQENPDCALIWTRPEQVSEGFARLLRFEDVDTEEILAEVDRFAELIVGAADRVRFGFVPTWTLPLYYRGRGLLDMRAGIGISNTLMQMNLRLAAKLAPATNIYVLDAQRWIALAGKRAFNPKLWHMGKIAFGNDVFAAAVRDLKAALRGITGQARKLIVVDLDDTLWGDIVGDVGRDHLRLGGHDPIGEAYVQFQRALRALTNRGLLLAVVSKNEESTALDAIDNHPEMVLRRDDFAGWRINWQDKAQNLADLVAELNLGLQSVVFIDDNPVERDRVRAAFPEVLVPEWPPDPMLYASSLMSLDCFDTATVSGEDSSRAAMYVAERKRRDLKGGISSVEDWLKSLETTVTVEPLTDVNRERTVQLLNKTNQMNLSTRRLTEAELTAWVQDPRHSLWTFRVADKFGESGLTAIASCSVESDTVRIVDFVLSCRVMGRKVEETMLHTVIEYARVNGARQVAAVLLPTEKNKPCLGFFANSPLSFDEATGQYTWMTAGVFPLPDSITLKQA